MSTQFDEALQASQPSSEQPTVGEFFGAISARYDESILRSVPPYWEILESLFRYTFLPREQSLHILELGCGTGNLSALAAEYFPKAHLTLVDMSSEMLAEAERKVQGKAAGYELIPAGFMDLDLPGGRYDLIISSIALHHLQDSEKPAMYQKIFSWLKPGGRFRCADEVLARPFTQAQTLNLELWAEWALQNGATAEEIQLWSDHAEKYDHYAPLASHFQWLSAAGFMEVECYWKKLLWAVFGGEKPLI